MTGNWPAIAPGDRLAVIAPSGPFDVDDFERGVTRLRQHYDVVVDAGITSRKGFLAGDDARRLTELRSALRDPQVRALVAARGGYGATRLLPQLSVDEVADAGKLLVGFSDITALHALWARAGVGSLHASMVAALGRGDDGQLQAWRSAVEGRTPGVISGLANICPGSAGGPLRGGNLAILCALLGTPYMPPLDGAVLLLEDIGERPYRIDRMLTSLLQSGVLDGVAAVTLGQFIDCEDPQQGATGVEEVLRERLSCLAVPVVGGVGSGHGDSNLALAFGRRVKIDAAAGTMTFSAE